MIKGIGNEDNERASQLTEDRRAGRHGAAKSAVAAACGKMQPVG